MDNLTPYLQWWDALGECLREERRFCWWGRDVRAYIPCPYN